jgi:hypothetical protein
VRLHPPHPLLSAAARVEDGALDAVDVDTAGAELEIGS